MWSNGIKCKYMFTFPLKNIARKGLKVKLAWDLVRSSQSFWIKMADKILQSLRQLKVLRWSLIRFILYYIIIKSMHDFFRYYLWRTSMGCIYQYRPPPLPCWYLGRGLLLSRNQPLSVVHICPPISQSGVRITLHPQHIHHLPRLQMSPETSQQQQESIMAKSHENTFHI